MKKPTPSLTTAATLRVTTVVLMWSLAPLAMADPLFGTYSETYASFQILNGPIQIVDCPHAPSVCGDGPRTAATSDFGFVNARAVANPTLGSLGATVDAHHEVLSGVGFDTRGSADAHIRTFWYDTFTVTSLTLAPGTPVAFLLEIDLSATLGAPPDFGACSTGGTGGCARAIASIHLGGPDGSEFVRIDVHTPRGAEAGPGLISTPNPVVGSLPTAVGAVITLWGELRPDAFVNATNGGDNFTAFVHAGSTANFFIESATDGADYVTASGVSYRFPTAAAPEPGSLALLCAGLAGLGFRRFSKQR